MTIPFIAVVRAKTSTDPMLLAAGATTVLSWAELPSCPEADDVPAVLFADSTGCPDDASLAAVLGALTSVDPLARPAGGSPPIGPDVVFATVRPVVDTLKLVDAAGIVTGTASRDGHRFVGSPIAARLRVLRAVAHQLAENAPPEAPPPLAVLSALVRRGVTVLGTPLPTSSRHP
jgi:hypothetical protein